MFTEQPMIAQRIVRAGLDGAAASSHGHSQPCAAELPRLVRRFRLDRASVALILAAAFLGREPAARAQLELRWEAPAGCPDRKEVIERIRALAGSALVRQLAPTAVNATLGLERIP